MESMRPPANAIDQAYLCAKAEQAEHDGSGGTVIPALPLEELLDTLDSRTGEGQTIPAAVFLSLFRRMVRQTTQHGEHALPLSAAELRALAALVGKTTELSSLGDPDDHTGTVLLFPTPPQLPADTYAEPA